MAPVTPARLTTVGWDISMPSRAAFPMPAAGALLTLCDRPRQITWRQGAWRILVIEQITQRGAEAPSHGAVASFEIVQSEPTYLLCNAVALASLPGSHLSLLLSGICPGCRYTISVTSIRR